MPNDKTKLFFEAIAGPILYDEVSPYRLMTKKLNDIDIDYFEGAVPLGKTVDKEIEIDIKHRILNDFVTYGNELLTNRAQTIEKVVVQNVRKLVAGYSDRSEALRDLNTSFGQMHQTAMFCSHTDVRQRRIARVVCCCQTGYLIGKGYRRQRQGCYQILPCFD